MFSELEITGRSRTHVVQFYEPRFAAHKATATAFMDMRNEARLSGIDLIPFSTFRDFKTQLRIWNHKYLGKKPLYDIDGNVRDYPSLDEEAIIRHILDWSALPGGSRHQWGTEIDVVDGAAMTDAYAPKLLPEEVREGGIFYPLHCWLDENIHKFGFFRPYKYFKGGMFPEPWHLSFAPVSMEAIKYLTPELLTSVIKDVDIRGKERVLEMIPEIYQNHILNIIGPDEQRG
jgi:LAS superfamily LD-carboxypeptidase LdcB